MFYRSISRLLLLPVLLLCTGLTYPVPTQEKLRALGLEEYARVVYQHPTADLPARWFMQSSIRVLTHPGTGVQLKLISLHHFGDATYFKNVAVALKEVAFVQREG